MLLLQRDAQNEVKTILLISPTYTFVFGFVALHRSWHHKF
jgi:hypothetical protein